MRVLRPARLDLLCPAFGSWLPPCQTACVMRIATIPTTTIIPNSAPPSACATAPVGVVRIVAAMIRKPTQISSVMMERVVSRMSVHPLPEQRVISARPG